jgi:HEAT repeat protein
MDDQRNDKDLETSVDADILQLITALADPAIDVRHRAIEKLGAMGKPAISLLIGALADAEDNDHRWYIATALSRIGAEAVNPLIQAMRDRPDPAFRRYAAAALGTIGAPAVEMLINAMGSDEPELRGYLSQALCRIGPPAVGPLTCRLDDPDETISACAALTLWQMGETGLPSIIKNVQENGNRDS